MVIIFLRADLSKLLHFLVVIYVIWRIPGGSLEDSSQAGQQPFNSKYLFLKSPGFMSSVSLVFLTASRIIINDTKYSTIIVYISCYVPLGLHETECLDSPAGF